MRYLKKIDNNRDDNYCFVYLDDNNEKKIFDILGSNIIFDVSKIDEESVKILISFFEKNDNYLGKIERKDLPVLMVIVEDLDGFDFKTEDVKLEFLKAKMIYNNIKQKDGIKCDFYVSSDLEYQIDNLSKEDFMFESEYFEEYYRLMILKIKKIESFYEGLDEKHKRIFLEEYEKISSIKRHETFEDSISHFRTSSPLVNIDILKKKLINAKK